ncbi:MAG TPA: hypothetical protein PKU83_11770 [Chryseolinea sp.]|nr:hypothetical protein [Chryseolinea sp.]
MTTKKGLITAEELHRQLESNPEYPKMMREKDEKMRIFKAELDKDEEGLVNEIKQKGINIDSVWDLVNNVKHPFLDNKFTGTYNQVYPILVDHLDKPHHERIREGIIRALTEKGARDLAKDKLLEHFYKEPDKNLRWVLANALTKVLTPTEKKKNPNIGLVKKGLV